MADSLTRIFSDLHYGDNASRAQSFAQLAPLCDGADHVIVNGDALDTQVIADGPGAIAELKAFFISQVPRATFITGNHDPDISELHECSLADGRVWLSHGDVLFEDVAPWSLSRAEIRRRVKHATQSLSAHEFSRIETRLKIHRQVCLKLPIERDHHTPGLWPFIKLLISVGISPVRMTNILRVWLATPRLAAKLAAAQRPTAQFLLLGHTHFPGIWRRSHGRVVINTGSFCPPRGALAVEIEGERLRVRPVERRTDAFRLGEICAEFPLADPMPSSLSAVV